MDRPVAILAGCLGRVEEARSVCLFAVVMGECELIIMLVNMDSKR